MVAGEARLPDRSWLPVRLWIDTGSPSLAVSPGLAARLASSGDAAAAFGLRLAGMELDLSSSGPPRSDLPAWIFAATGADATLPATVLSQYRVTFDLPGRNLLLASPKGRHGSGPGDRAAGKIEASVNRSTGIVAVTAYLGDRPVRLALDLGASFSFLDADLIGDILARHPDWPRFEGSAGTANMWGWFFPDEEDWEVLRSDQLRLGDQQIEDFAFVALPRASVGGLGPWYSRKTAIPVTGFLGSNAFRDFVLEIDYAGGSVSLTRGASSGHHDLDALPIGVRPEEDGGYSVAAVAHRAGQPLLQGLEPGDRLLSVDGHSVRGLTMGGLDALMAGAPGDRHRLRLEREGRDFELDASVLRLP